MRKVTKKSLLSVKRPVIYKFKDSKGKRKVITYIPGDKKSKSRLQKIDLRTTKLVSKKRYTKPKNEQEILRDIVRRVKFSKYANKTVSIKFYATLTDGTKFTSGVQKIVIKKIPSTYQALLDLVNNLFIRYEFKRIRMEMKVREFKFFSKRELQKVKLTTKAFRKHTTRKRNKKRAKKTKPVKNRQVRKRKAVHSRRRNV